MVAKTKVFVVDDSALVRQFMTEVIQCQPDMQLLGTAADPIKAMPKLEDNWPDVIVLDMEMPNMDGLTFLRQLMITHPTPVVICSSLTDSGAALTLEALSAGAVAVFAKAKLGVRQHLESIASELLRAIREAGVAKAVHLERSVKPATVFQNAFNSKQGINLSVGVQHTTDRIVAIGTSTGGTIALEKVLTSLPADSPGIVIVQHMPEKFTAAFAERLNSICALEVREAKNGDRVMDGIALIAPGGLHLQLNRSGAHYCVEVKDGPPVNRHRPSVDVLFRSVARSAGANALGIIMTGMGDDGARGLLAMREAGAKTIAQDEATCVVFGMPKEAIRMGAAGVVMPLEQLPMEIMSFLRAGIGRN